MDDDFQEGTESNIFACYKGRSSVWGETELGELKTHGIRVSRRGMGTEEDAVDSSIRGT